nr:ribonuclease H-like domain-containing protein [Tanacetum cinerariifolium]
MRPFRCPITILNTKDHLGKFDSKANEGFFVGYSLNSKAFRVFNSRTKIVKENLHIRFSKSTPNLVGSRQDWLFDIDALTRTLNYEPIIAGTQSNGFAGTKASDNESQAIKETKPDDGFKPSSDDRKKVDEDPSKGNECYDQEKEINNTNNVNNVSSTVNAASINKVNAVGELPFDPDMPALEDVGTFDFSNKDEDDNAVADMNNLDTTIQIKEEMYVCQPPGFEDPDFLNRVYKVEKALYELHQAPRAWFTKVKNASTPMETQKTLLKDEDSEEVDVYMYRSMIGSLMYFTSLRPDIMFAGRNLDNFSRKFLMYLRFIQVFLDKQLDGMSNHEKKYISPSHIKKIFENMRRIEKGFSGRITPLFPTMVVQSQLGEGSIMPTGPHHTPIILHSSISQPQKTHKPRKPKRKVTQVPQLSGPTESVTDEAVYKELDDSLVRVATTASSLKAEQVNGNIDKAQSKATPNESISQGTDLSGGPRCQESIRDTIAQTRFENVSKHSNDSLLAREKTKTSQGNKITSLKRRAKKLEKRNKSRTHKLKRLYKVGLIARVESSDNEKSLANVEMFDADKDLGGEEVFVKQEVVVDKKKIDEVTLAQALAELKTLKPKGVVIQEPSESPITTTTVPKQKSHDKGKRIMVEEPVKHKRKDQIRLDEEATLKLQAEIDTWDDVQAKIDADYQLAERLQAEEQQELTDEKKATLFMQFLEKRRKAFKRVNTSEPISSELVQGKEKRAGEELIQKRAKKKKVNDDKETAELKELMEIIPDKKEVAIDAISLAVKSLGIVDWKKLDDFEEEYQVYGRIVRIKSLLDIVGITAA